MPLRVSTALRKEAPGRDDATILARRLQRCREALADPAFRHRSVSEIAFAWGFNDGAHFSRAF